MNFRKVIATRIAIEGVWGSPKSERFPLTMGKGFFILEREIMKERKRKNEYSEPLRTNLPRCNGTAEALIGWESGRKNLRNPVAPF